MKPKLSEKHFSSNQEYPEPPSYDDLQHLDVQNKNEPNVYIELTFNE